MIISILKSNSEYKLFGFIIVNSKYFLISSLKFPVALCAQELSHQVCNVV